MYNLTFVSGLAEKIITWVWSQHTCNTVQNKFSPWKALECFKQWSSSPSDLSGLRSGRAPVLWNMQLEYYQPIRVLVGGGWHGLTWWVQTNMAHEVTALDQLDPWKCGPAGDWGRKELEVVFWQHTVQLGPVCMWAACWDWPVRNLVKLKSNRGVDKWTDSHGASGPREDVYLFSTASCVSQNAPPNVIKCTERLLTAINHVLDFTKHVTVELQ